MNSIASKNDSDDDIYEDPDETDCNINNKTLSSVKLLVASDNDSDYESPFNSDYEEPPEDARKPVQHIGMYP